MVFSASSLVACLPIIVRSISVEKICCVLYNPWQDWVLVCNLDVVVC